MDDIPKIEYIFLFFFYFDYIMCVFNCMSFIHLRHFKQLFGFYFQRNVYILGADGDIKTNFHVFSRQVCIVRMVLGELL